jgi:fructose-1,6-bisphosphatase/inositol monophosphatase family enzyme
VSVRTAIPADDRAHALHDLLTRAGDAALARVDTLDVRTKADGTRVTDADLAAADVLLEGLARLWPGEDVRSEEAGDDDAVGPGAAWYVDPIDGTGAFTEGLAHWGPTVCRTVDGRLDLGAFLEPRLGAFWFAADGGGAWRGARRLAPADPPADDPNRTLYLPSRAHLLGPLAWPGKMRALGCSAAHLAQVAAGGAAATIVPVWCTWDIGCGVLLVREAGRAVTDLAGRPFDLVAHRGRPLLAAPPSLVHPLVEAVQRALAGMTGS